MKILKRVEAFFTKDSNAVELNLTSSETREGRAYLHLEDKRIVKSHNEILQAQKVY